MADAAHDSNSIPTLIAVSSSDGSTPVRIYGDPATHRLKVDTGGGGGGTGTWWKVNGTVNGSNVTFTISTEVLSDFLLVLARQPQAQTVGADTWDYSYVAAAGTTTITYVVAPDASLSAQPHQAFVVT